MLVPYFKLGTTVKQLHALVGSNPRDLLVKPSNVLTLQEIYDLLPKYIITSPDDPPPCPCDGTGAPFILFSQSSNSMMLDVASWHQINPLRVEIPPIAALLPPHKSRGG